MVKKNSICTLCSAMIMLLLPWCAVTFVKAEGGMAAVLMLFFAVDPIAAICVGVFAGKNAKAAWFQPLILSVLFLSGAWIFVDGWEPAFLLYAAAYLALGYLTMVIVATWSKIRG